MREISLYFSGKLFYTWSDKRNLWSRTLVMRAKTCGWSIARNIVTYSVDERAKYLVIEKALVKNFHSRVREEFLLDPKLYVQR